MQYRKFGQLDWDVSILGFGAMRFPTQDGKIDESKATKMLYRAIDQGVNYVDTAYPYHDGQSEVLLGKVLQDGYRKKAKIATKLPSWAVNEAADFDKYFNEQCERLQRDFVDFYLLHALNRAWWPKLRDLGVLDWAEQKIREGRIGHLGFSFHDDNPTFEEIVDAYDWALCQIQYNYMDIKNQAGTK
jgi:predicted aldo/keto reductase-like oxidoreductase